MNTKSFDSTDWAGLAKEVDRQAAELERHFPNLAAPPEGDEPAAGIFLPIELARFPEPSRQLLARLGLAFFRLARTLGRQLPAVEGRRGLPPLAELLPALEAELRYAASTLEAAVQLEKLAAAGPESLQSLALRSLRRLTRFVRDLERDLEKGRTASPPEPAQR